MDVDYKLNSDMKHGPLPKYKAQDTTLPKYKPRHTTLKTDKNTQRATPQTAKAAMLEENTKIQPTASVPNRYEDLQLVIPKRKGANQLRNERRAKPPARWRPAQK